MYELIEKARREGVEYGAPICFNKDKGKLTLGRMCRGTECGVDITEERPQGLEWVGVFHVHTDYTLGLSDGDIENGKNISKSRGELVVCVATPYFDKAVCSYFRNGQLIKGAIYDIQKDTLGDYWITRHEWMAWGPLRSDNEKAFELAYELMDKLMPDVTEEMKNGHLIEGFEELIDTLKSGWNFCAFLRRSTQRPLPDCYTGLLHGMICNLEDFLEELLSEKSESNENRGGNNA